MRVYTYNKLPEKIKEKIAIKLQQRNLDCDFYFGYNYNSIDGWIDFLKYSNLYDEECEIELFALTMSVDN